MSSSMLFHAIAAHGSAAVDTRSRVCDDDHLAVLFRHADGIVAHLRQRVQLRLHVRSVMVI